MNVNTDIEALKEAVRTAPQDPETWKALAAGLAEQGQSQKALEAYRRSLELSGSQSRIIPVMKFLETLPLPQKETVEQAETVYTDTGLLSGVSLPLWFQVFLGLFSFLMMLLMAVAQKWTATDLVWSLWISSIVLGYSFILSAIVAMFLDGRQEGLAGAVAAKLGEHSTGLAFLARVPGALFMLLFFSVHFLFFHFVHSIFLNLFFPLVREDVFNSIGPNYFINLMTTCIRRFWPFIMMSAISQLGSYLRAFQKIDSSLLSMPYKNVVRMHLSIFVFAFLHMSGVSEVVLYFVLVLYFFPFRGLWNFLKETFKRPEESLV